MQRKITFYIYYLDSRSLYTSTEQAKHGYWRDIFCFVFPAVSSLRQHQSHTSRKLQVCLPRHFITHAISRIRFLPQSLNLEQHCSVSLWILLETAKLGRHQKERERKKLKDELHSKQSFNWKIFYINKSYKKYNCKQ